MSSATGLDIIMSCTQRRRRSVALAFDGVKKVDELNPDYHSPSGTISNIAVRK
jgi:hypothetical protein